MSLPAPGALADRLGALPVRVQTIEVRRAAVPVPDYAGAARPSSVVWLSGGGAIGRGENVAFTDEEQARFAARPSSLLNSGLRRDGIWAGRVDALVGPTTQAYERAALEAALIDLALRQAGITLAALAGVSARSLRVVLSFAARPDAAAYVRRLRAAGRTEDLKIDVEPTWDAAARAALAGEPGVAVLDFKGRGDTALAEALAAQFPRALFEDPPVGTTHPRVARDAPLTTADAVAEALARGEAVNLKAPRMAGPLEVLRALEHVRAAGADALAYLGGMFEVDVGRAQARQLAALFCAEGPNDLAPFDAASDAGRLQVHLDGPGFG